MGGRTGTIFQTKVSPGLFGLHILNSYHAWKNVFFLAYSKIKVFTHRGQPYQARWKSWKTRKRYKKSWHFEIFALLNGGDERVPCARNLWLSSMLSYEHYFQRGLHEKCALWKVLKGSSHKNIFFSKTHFYKKWFNDVSFTSNCFHLRSIASQLVTHTKNAIEL